MTTELIVWCAALSVGVLFMIFTPLWLRAEDKAQRLTLLGAGFAVIAAACAGYAMLGGWRTLPAINAVFAEREAQQQELIDSAKDFQDHPDALDAVVRHATALGKAGRHADAAELFRKAILLSKGRPDIILNYATALILAANGEISDDANQSIDMVLLLAPQEPKARYFKAVYLQQHDKKEDAKKLLTELRASLKPNDTLATLIDDRLKELATPTVK